MTDHKGNRKIYLVRRILEGLKTGNYCLTKEIIIIILKNMSMNHNNGLSKTKRQTLTLYN